MLMVRGLVRTGVWDVIVLKLIRFFVRRILILTLMLAMNRLWRGLTILFMSMPTLTLTMKVSSLAFFWYTLVGEVGRDRGEHGHRIEGIRALP